MRFEPNSLGVAASPATAIAVAVLVSACAPMSRANPSPEPTLLVSPAATTSPPTPTPTPELGRFEVIDGEAQTQLRWGEDVPYLMPIDDSVGDIDTRAGMYTSLSVRNTGGDAGYLWLIFDGLPFARPHLAFPDAVVVKDTATDKEILMLRYESPAAGDHQVFDLYLTVEGLEGEYPYDLYIAAGGAGPTSEEQPWGFDIQKTLSHTVTIDDGF